MAAGGLTSFSAGFGRTRRNVWSVCGVSLPPGTLYLCFVFGALILNTQGEAVHLMGVLLPFWVRACKICLVSFWLIFRQNRCAKIEIFYVKLYLFHNYCHYFNIYIVLVLIVNVFAANKIGLFAYLYKNRLCGHDAM